MLLRHVDCANVDGLLDDRDREAYRFARGSAFGFVLLASLYEVECDFATSLALLRQSGQSWVGCGIFTEISFAELLSTIAYFGK